MSMDDKMEKIVSLCKRRGFIFPGSEIYGGLSSTYSYGPYGAELKRNIKNLWWNRFVSTREDIVGMDGPILLHPRLWEASGHVDVFGDAMVDCKKCKKRFRADHLVFEATGKDLEGNFDEMNRVLHEEKVPCPECGAKSWTEVRFFKMMFTTQMNGIEEDIYLRPETAGAIFVDFKNIVQSTRVRVPFGIAQIGKAFRNEIVTGNFIFRLREFEQMEIEYFIHPKAKWEQVFEELLLQQEAYASELGLDKENLQRYEHKKEKLSHYSKKTVDIEYNFPFGFSELFGCAHRGDFDLTQHAKATGEKLDYLDPVSSERYVPHVIEPTFGVELSILAVLCSAYHEETLSESDTRVVMKFPVAIAPVKIAIFPLLKNKPDLVAGAREIFEELSTQYACEFDDNGNIGKRYRRQDEIGTPFCVTFDFESLDDASVTVRDRDSMQQERVAISELIKYFHGKLS